MRLTGKIRKIRQYMFYYFVNLISAIYQVLMKDAKDRYNFDEYYSNETRNDYCKESISN